ncbi:hypothetical protein [Gemmata massiliana]|uniref:hypothetical protein n=1 Tax=Gemmata massiliana TaxID=1210884 RepID=UPI001E53F6A8|nr:hypothetical protein [Gemmata massiliana]
MKLLNRTHLHVERQVRAGELVVRPQHAARPPRHVHPRRGASARPDVNAYGRRAAGAEFTAKDFCTWAGGVKAATKLAALPKPETKTEAERAVRNVVREVAIELGTRPRCVARAMFTYGYWKHSPGTSSPQRAHAGTSRPTKRA